MQAGLGLAHMLAGRFEMASSWAEKAFRELPDFGVACGILAASYALAGRMDAAGRTMQHLRRIDPGLRVSNISWLSFRRPQDLELFADGLRKAGLPE